MSDDLGLGMGIKNQIQPNLTQFDLIPKKKTVKMEEKKINLTCDVL